ncbi:hypothetical protein DL771_004164 [Monosporascus sp. 5C6A]|nr:hypothetical protein DL771_004164 [Monosporascus sp. 5C6A]
MGSLYSGPQLIVSVDFGTTFSAVSYDAVNPDEAAERIGLGRIRSMENWPGYRNIDGGSHMKQQVPSEDLYPMDPKFRDAADLQTRDRDSDPFDIGGLLDMIPDSDEDTDVTLFGTNVNAFNAFKWGYSVHEALSKPSTHFKRANKTLGRFKLLFDDRPTTETVRRELASTLTSLKIRKLLRNHGEIVADYLTCLLRHVKRELQRRRLYNGYQVEMVLCVLAIWSQKACRDMQVALTAAMRMADFKRLDLETDAIENLFIVSEPEAAAAHTTPLKLTKEIVQPGGDLCGSSYLDEAFRGLLRGNLKDEKHLERGQVTLDGIVENILISESEYKTKRQYDIYDRRRLPKSFYCSGLQDNHEKGFLGGCVYIRFGEMRAIFHKRLERMVGLMEQQIMGAASGDVRVDWVDTIDWVLKKGTETRLHGYASLSQGLIQPIYNHIPEGRNKGMRVGKSHYQVDYTKVIKVVDRDLRCYAIYGGEIVKKWKIDVAAASLLGSIAAYK